LFINAKLTNLDGKWELKNFAASSNAAMNQTAAVPSSIHELGNLIALPAQESEFPEATRPRESPGAGSRRGSHCRIPSQ